MVSYPWKEKGARPIGAPACLVLFDNLGDDEGQILELHVPDEVEANRIVPHHHSADFDFVSRCVSRRPKSKTRKRKAGSIHGNLRF